MKKFFLVLVVIIKFLNGGYGQSHYNPSLGTVSNKPYSPSQAVPTDGRTYFYDTLNFKYRAYLNNAEVISYLNQAKYRVGQFDIVVNTGGTLLNGVITGGQNVVWYFRDGTTDGDLIPKVSTSAVPNANIGLGYRIIVPNTSSVKTIHAGIGIFIDSTRNDNELTVSVDSSVVPTLTTLAGLRALSNPSASAIYYTTDNAGNWHYDATDVSSADNMGTILVSGTKRFKRIYSGPIDVTWFGVTGTGVANIGTPTPHDDYVGLQAAFDAAGDHGTVYVPSNIGEIYTSATIHVTHFNIKVISDLQGTYVPFFRGIGAYYIFSIENAGFTALHIGWKGDGDKYVDSATYTPRTKGIIFNRDTGSHVDNLANIDAKLEGCVFAYLDTNINVYGRNANILDNDFTNGVTGVVINRVGTTDCRGHQIIRNRFHSNGQGTRTLANESWCVSFTSPAIFGNTVNDNIIDGKSRGFFKGGLAQNTINNNHGSLMYGDFIHVTDPSGAFWYAWSINGNTVDGIQSDPTAPGQIEYGIIADNNTDNGKIENNTFSYTVKDGINLPSVSGTSIVGNVILTPNKTAATVGSLYDGIHIGGGSSNLISNNFIRSTQPGGVGHRYGIYNNATGSTFTFNFGYNQATAFFNDLQAASSRVQNDAEPNNVRSYYNGSVLNSESGFDAYNVNSSSSKFLGGAFRMRLIDNTASAESVEGRVYTTNAGTLTTALQILKEGALTIGTRTPALAQNGVINTRLIYLDKTQFNPSDSSVSSTYQFMVDGGDSKVKYKDGSSILQEVLLAKTSQYIPSVKIWNPSVSAASGSAKGSIFAPTLTAIANNDTLIGISGLPTYTDGAFTGVKHYFIKAVGDVISIGASGGVGRMGGTGSGSALFDSPSGGDLCLATSGTIAARLSGTNRNFLVNTSTDLASSLKLQVVGKSYYSLQHVFDGTFTAAGTTGAQTINKPVGSVNFAAGASSLVLTNSVITSSAKSAVFVQVATADATLKSCTVAIGTGTVTITGNASATAETKVLFWVFDIP